MCGIVAYLGRQQAGSVLVNGLRRLEYRGYDSAGLVTVRTAQRSGGAVDSTFDVRRVVGRVARLSSRVDVEPVDGTVGIAHTRWATHGRPVESNAHPHRDSRGRIALVHNGVIENHADLRASLVEAGVTFQSETDSESLIQLIGYLYDETGDFVASVREALSRVHGSFGLAIVCVDEPDMLIAARRGSPLVVGIGDDEFVVASDASAIVAHTGQAVYLDDNELATLTRDGWQAELINATPVEKTVHTLDLTAAETGLNGYPHYMLKEIFEQPERLMDCLRGRLDGGTGDVRLGGLSELRRELAGLQRMVIFGCGTAWHAALIGRCLHEELARIPTAVEYASELRYRNPIVESGTVAVAVSQSGETADTLAALREVQTRGAMALGLVNVVGSTIARDTDAGIHLRAGPEIGVASTKAFTAQVAALTMLAMNLGRRRHLSPERMSALFDGLQSIPELIDETLGLNRQVQDLAERLADCPNWLYLGRGVSFPVALEGALKLKEVSYLHAEGLPAAEMKHGPIAMIDEQMPVVVIAPHDHHYGKVLANIEEVCSRNGRVIAVATHPDADLERLAEDVLYVPPTLPLLSPLVTTVPLQLLAYHVAVLRGLDVDKPRNLAKSVTVE